MGLEPPGSAAGQQLLKKKPTLNTKGMDYEQTNLEYALAHVAGTLSDADYVEWIVSVLKHVWTPVDVNDQMYMRRCGTTSSTTPTESLRRSSTSMQARWCVHSLTKCHV